MNVLSQADPILAAIGARQVLSYETIELKGRWVSEKLRDELSRWDYSNPGRLGPVLINAPTGSGKSTFVMRDLANRVGQFGKNVLLLSNRSALELQQKYNMTQAGSQRWSGEALSEIVQCENVFITTYHGVHDLRRGPNWWGRIPNIAAVVFDEAHFFSSDATFNANTGDILREILYTYFDAQRIYMSATPEVVKELVAHEEFALQNIIKNGGFGGVPQIQSLGKSCATIKEYCIIPDYSYVDLSVFKDWEKIEKMILENKEDEKWLVFVSDKESGKKLKKKLGKIAEYIDATAKTERTQYFQDLVRRGWFEKRVLITTSALDNGVSFLDPLLVHVVIDSTDPVQVKQMLGRKRINEREAVNLHIMHKTKKQIDEERKRLTDDYKLLREFRLDARGFLGKRWGHLTEHQQQMFALKNGILQCSAYAQYQINCRIAQLNGLSDQLAAGDEYAFEKEVCKWFGKPLSLGTLDVMSTEEMVKEQLVKVYEKYCEESPLDCEQLKQFLKEILVVVKSFKPSEIGIRNEDKREKANINGVATYFGLPYICKKANKQWIVECQ